MLANGVVGGLALFSLILMTTVVVFGIKFVLDRNLAENPKPEAPERPREEVSPEPEKKPLYMIKQPTAPRKKRSSRPRAQYAVLPEGSVYTLEPVKEKEKESAAS